MPRSNVLVVESTVVRNLIGAILEKEPYQLVLEDVARGRTVLETDGSRFDLLITNEPWLFEPFPDRKSVV